MIVISIIAFFYKMTQDFHMLINPGLRITQRKHRLLKREGSFLCERVVFEPSFLVDKLDYYLFYNVQFNFKK
jgi:hypothetical protein